MPEQHIPTLAELRERHGDDLDALAEAAEAARDQHEARMHAVHADARGADLTASQQARWDAHSNAAAELRQHVADRRADRLRESRQRNGSTRFGSDVEPAGPRGFSAARSSALRFADDFNRRGLLADQGRERIQRLMDHGSLGARSAAAEWGATAGDPAYLRAIAKVAANPTMGHMEWTGEEADAYRATVRWKREMEQRTALVTSGYVLPSVLDPAIMLTSAGSINPLRRLAKVVTTTTSTWRGITSAGATAEWKTEGSQAADGTPAAAEVEIPVFLADVDAIYSYEVEQDALDLVGQLLEVIRDSIDNLQATAFTTGNGTTAPQGIVTGLAGTASEINGAGTEVLDSDDPVTLQNALPARFSANASWMSHIAIRNTLAFFETTNGALLYPELRQSPPMLLTKPWFENSNMDGSLNAAATENNYVLVYGDVRAGFVIVDHIGATVEFLPGYGANQRPTAQRHAFVTSRHGSEVVVANALRMLDIPTTA